MEDAGLRHLRREVNGYLDHCQSSGLARFETDSPVARWRQRTRKFSSTYPSDSRDLDDPPPKLKLRLGKLRQGVR